VKNRSNDYICVSFCFSMTEEKKKLLTDLEFRVRQVMYMCDTLRNENHRLRSDLQVVQQQLVDKTEQLDQLKTKYDSLKTARTITAASVDVKVAKNKLSKLVREVDKCINLLS
jgi:chromosome segregation ATPase